MRMLALSALCAACLSSTAAKSQGAADAPGSVVGSYFVFQHTDPMTDQVRGAAILKSGDLVFGIGCMIDGKTVQAFVQSPDEISPTSPLRSEVTFRVNANSPLKQDWYYKGNIAFGSEKNTRALVDELRQAFKVVVRMATRQGGYSDTVFDVSETVPALRDMASKCDDAGFRQYVANL
jgi:hypothetical protein